MGSGREKTRLIRIMYNMPMCQLASVWWEAQEGRYKLNNEER